MLHPDAIEYRLDETLIIGAPQGVRRLSDLRGIFADNAAYEAALAAEDAIIYRVASIETAAGDGQLGYTMAMLMPGRIGAEYYMTKGHFHAYRPAAEVYIGLRGEGLMLLESEAGETQTASLRANHIVYVPGNTAHRTINVGDEPLIYMGIYPANAGYDYASMAASNFRSVVVAVDGRPTVITRADYLAQPRM